MMGLRATAGRRQVWMLALVVAVFGCGHSSDTSGPSRGTTTASSVSFGSNNPQTVAAFGDSITLGVLEERRIRAALETSNNYPNILQGLLQRLDPAWRVTNRGRGGELVQGGATRIGEVLRSDRPGFILIMEGTNNASRCDDAALIRANLRTMVERAKANQTIPLLGTIPPNFRNDPCAHDVIDAANSLIRALASAEGIVLAEIFDGMNNRELFGLAPDRDPLHPNEEGYRVMANIWLAALKQAIPGGGTVVALHPKRK